MHGVESVEIDVERDRFTVSYDEDEIQTPAMFNAVKALGYAPSVAESLIIQKATPEKVAMPQQVQKLLNQNVTIFLYFGAKWCGACKLMERATFADEQVGRMLAAFANLKVDIDDDVNVAESFSISAVPTVILLSSSGEELDRHVGPLSPEEMVLLLEGNKRK